ncbi:MAG: hypothetical protein MI749_02900 [Desulfovibrionales bacterium]|nr:hypothetical protein [Desulfovibrionales bacterium]
MPICVTKFVCIFCGQEFETGGECREHENTHAGHVDLDGLKLPLRYRTKDVRIESRELEFRMDHFEARWRLEQQPENAVLQAREGEAFQRLDSYLRGVPYQNRSRYKAA